MNRVIAFLTSLLSLSLATSAILQADFITTVGVYDENVVQTNAVDFNATNSLTVAEFSTRIANAYANDSGGVIDARSLTNGAYCYGVSQNKGLRLDMFTYVGIGAPTTNPVTISTDGAFATTSNGGFNFAQIDVVGIDGGSPNEQIVSIGVTVLSVNNRNYGTVTVSALLHSGGIVSAFRQISENAGLGDTFFGMDAPRGDYITGLRLEYDGPIVSDVRLWFDDIGFITSSIPEPTCGVFLAGAAGILLVTRKRSQGKT